MCSSSADVDRLYSLLYEDLRSMAHHRLTRSEPITLLDTTSLVHESYFRFVKAGQLGNFNQSQFLGYASHVMRSVIVDLVRRRRADRRGGGAVHIEIEDADVATDEDNILRVNDALEELAKVDARLVQVVEMRYFAGFEEQEIAVNLGVTERTVRRDWRKARMLLSLALT